VVLDIDAKVVEANHRFAEMLGYTLEEVYKLHTWDWDKNYTQEQLLEMGWNADEQGIHLETKHTRKDGSVIDVDISISAAMCSGQKLIFCVQRDITDRKKAEKAEREAEEEKSAFLEEAPVGIIHTDIKGNITYVNKRFESETGYSRKEIVGKSCFEIDWLPANTMRYLTQRMAARLKGNPSKHWETPFKCKNGQWIWITLEGKILRKSKVPVGFQIIAVNITERKEAEEALRQSEERYRTILEETEDAYFEVDLGGHFTFINNSVCRDLGYSRKELMGMSYKEITVKEDLESVFKVFNEVYQTGMPNRGFPWRTIRKDKSCGFAETSVSLILSHEGKIIGFRGVGRDISE
jgi:PAS domain S-box-containing protein